MLSSLEGLHDIKMEVSCNTTYEEWKLYDHVRFCNRHHILILYIHIPLFTRTDKTEHADINWHSLYPPLKWAKVTVAKMNMKKVKKQHCKQKQARHVSLCINQQYMRLVFLSRGDQPYDKHTLYFPFGGKCKILRDINCHFSPSV